MGILEYVLGDLGKVVELLGQIIVDAVDAVWRLLEGIAQLPLLLIDFVDLLGPAAAGLTTVIMVAVGALVVRFIMSIV